MKNYINYFDYLKKRSVYGLVYRRFYLYPRLCRFLNGRVLDVGCGIGDMLRFRKNTVGVDVNPTSVAWCRSQGFSVYHMETDRLPFSNGVFESVVLDNVMEHLVAPSSLIHEIKRVLVKGGTVIAGVPGKKGFMSDSDHKVFYSEDDLKRMMSESGFMCDRIFCTPIRSEWLNTRMRQYCVYGVFSKI